jgi:hypothetical protein
MKTHSRPFNSERGSVLIVALILALVIAVIMASHVSLASNALKVSNRSFYANAALGVAETGIEQALWALNASNKGTSGAWDNWETLDGNARRKFGDFELGRGITGDVSVIVTAYQSANPVVLAKASINVGPKSAPVEKWLRVTLSNGASGGVPDRSRSLFAFGLLARESLYANGGAWMDSWKSDPDNDPSTPVVPWSPGVALSNARIAVASKANEAMWIDGADIYGTASIGSSTSSGLKMKAWDGQIGPRGTTYTGSYRVTSGALAMDFTATAETVEAPTGATVRASYVLPRNVSGPPYYISAESMGTTGATTVLQLDKVTVEGAATLTIKGDLTLYMPPSGVETLKVAGSGKILLENGATLKIVTPGNIAVSGAGIANAGSPSNVQIWSTSNGTTGQTISLQGSGQLSAILYAPDAALTLPGHTDFSGAAVVRTARLTGSGAFHYDESLEHFTGGTTPPETSGGGVAGVISIESYSELTTPSDRADYLALLVF